MSLQRIPSTTRAITHHFASGKTETFKLVDVRLLQPSHSNLILFRGGFSGLGGLHGRTDSWSARIDLRPIPSGIIEALLRGREVLGDLCVLGVVRFGRAQKRLEGDQGGFEGEDGGPSVLEDVQADGARDRGDVRVVDFGEELHLDGLEWVGFGNHDVLFFV